MSYGEYGGWLVMVSCVDNHPDNYPESCHNHCDHHTINIGVAGDHGDHGAGGHGDGGDHVDNDNGMDMKPET